MNMNHNFLFEQVKKFFFKVIKDQVFVLDYNSIFSVSDYLIHVFFFFFGYNNPYSVMSSSSSRFVNGNHNDLLTTKSSNIKC